MVKRVLPSQRNPLLKPDKSPKHDFLIERRRLGQTDLKVSPSGSTSFTSTKAESWGVFDYAHLRVPLPPDLERSGIFTPLRTGQYPESYFLMRRSSDGYISATGMYKAAFPWSSVEEEQAERKHHKTLASGKGQEVAGNVWIAPDDALKLADDYAIRLWIVALLDPTPIEIGSRDKAVGEVSSPPKFIVQDKEKLQPNPELAAPTPRSRSKRSASPSKSKAEPGATPRKIASPRKRAPRTKTEDKDKVADKRPKTALSEVMSNGAPPTANGEPAAATGDVVRVAVQETVEKSGDGGETVHTKVSVALPADRPELAIPESAEAVVEKARAMVEEAAKLDKGAKGRSTKRKASTSLTKEGAAADKGAEAQPPAKKPKTALEETLVKERVRTRALIGLTATLAVGAIIPYFL